MRMVEIIEHKRDKKVLTDEEIKFFISNYVKGEIPDYQASSLLMAILLNGMNDHETFILTECMLHSGDVMDLSKINGVKVDKHSTGGVGDKTSLVLGPLVASCGAKLAKMSGRGLGFTGGTVDKLESIPGYMTNIDINTFVENVEKIGISMISQTLNLAPADKKIYALRDSISCVESIPLIASSIMSKKIASGAEKIVLDVTVGSGAFMKNIESAVDLANEMIEIGKLANRETICILTNMDEPLGYSVGNNLEVIEAVNFLKGKMPEDLKEVVLELGAYMIKLAGLGDDIEDNKIRMLENINNGMAFNKFIELIKSEKNRGKTILLSSHIFSEVDATCDRIAIIKDGEIVSIFNASDLKHATQKTYNLQFKFDKDYKEFIKKSKQVKYFKVVSKSGEKLKATIITDDKQINKVVSLLSKYEIKEFANIKETLEDYFMKYYKEDTVFRGLKNG